MKRLHWRDLRPEGGGHILRGVLPGAHLVHGGLAFLAPGERTHDTGCTCPACDGRGRHIHPDDHEAFLVLQGRIRIEGEGAAHELAAGDIVVCEPGEDHHLVGGESPCAVLWLHAGDAPPAA